MLFSDIFILPLAGTFVFAAARGVAIPPSSLKGCFRRDSPGFRKKKTPTDLQADRQPSGARHENSGRWTAALGRSSAIKWCSPR